MIIAPKLVKQLDENNIPYDIINHRFSITSLNTAKTANVPEAELVKPVILQDQSGYVMALVPSNRHVVINQLNMFLNRSLELSTEATVSGIFNDCERGAVPPVGEAYGIETIVDYNFDECSDVYLEAGNHTDVLHLSGRSFQKLMEASHHASICMH